MDAHASHLTAIRSMKLLNLAKIFLQTRTTNFATMSKKLRLTSVFKNVKLMIVTKGAIRRSMLNLNDVPVRQNVHVN